MLCKQNSNKLEFKKVTNVTKIKLSFPNEPIEPTESCKFLGVYINSNLDWTDQITHARKLISQSIGALYSIKSSIPQKILRTVYFSLVQPYFIYAMPIWATNHKSHDFDSLFKLQKKAVRIITNHTNKINGHFQHTKPLFKKSNILTIHNLYFYATACEAIKIINSKRPRSVYNLYRIFPSTRLALPKFNGEKYKSKSFIFTSSKIINYFTANNIKYSCTSSTFKLNLKRFLMARQNISLENDPNWITLNFSIFSDVNIFQ